MVVLWGVLLGKDGGYSLADLSFEVSPWTLVPLFDAHFLACCVFGGGVISDFGGVIVLAADSQTLFVAHSEALDIMETDFGAPSLFLGIFCSPSFLVVVLTFYRVHLG